MHPDGRESWIQLSFFPFKGTGYVETLPHGAKDLYKTRPEVGQYVLGRKASQRDLNVTEGLRTLTATEDWRARRYRVNTD